MMLATWNARTVFRCRSLTALARELANSKLDAEGVEAVKWNEGGTKPDNCTFYLETTMRIVRRHFRYKGQ
jgi:hypothetical protein